MCVGSRSCRSLYRLWLYSEWDGEPLHGFIWRSNTSDLCFKMLNTASMWQPEWMESRSEAGKGESYSRSQVRDDIKLDEGGGSWDYKSRYIPGIFGRLIWQVQSAMGGVSAEKSQRWLQGFGPEQLLPRGCHLLRWIEFQVSSMSKGKKYQNLCFGNVKYKMPTGHLNIGDVEKIIGYMSSSCRIELWLTWNECIPVE